MKTIDRIINLRFIAVLFAAATIASCSSDDDAPAEEQEVEVITNVTLIFTNDADDTDVVRATAVDADGPGIGELEVTEDIILAANTSYTMTYEILNAVDPDDVEDIGDEILEEDNEHQFFYSFTADIFSNPVGNGNVDTASDPVNYNDMDENMLPVGLSTAWTTGDAATGTFTAKLQHQPDVKTETSGANDGDTDFDLTFDLTIQ